MSEVFVQQGVLGYILGGKGALHNQFPFHGPSVNNLDDVNKVLGTLEAAYEFGMIGSAANVYILCASVTCEVL